MKQQDLRVRHNPESPRSNRANVKNADPRATPEVRIGRRVLWVSTDQIPGWHDFLDEHGQYHYGDGVTRTLGSMAVTYFSANDMGRMLSERYPRDYGNGATNKTRGLMNKFHKSFIGYIKAQDKATTAMLQAIDSVELSARTEDDLMFIPDLDWDLTRAGTNKLWQSSVFHVRGVEPYGKVELGLDLTHPENDPLRAERQTIMREFLRNELHLATHHLTASFDPHITFFEGNNPVSQFHIRDVAHPSEIMLGAPEAIVNSKK